MATAGPITGSELIVAIQDDVLVYLTRPQVTALLSKTPRLDDRFYYKPSPLNGTETIRAIQNGQPIDMNRDAFAAFLGGTATPIAVDPDNIATDLSGAEQIIGAQNGFVIAFTLAEVTSTFGGNNWLTLGGQFLTLNGEVLTLGAA